MPRLHGTKQQSSGWNLVSNVSRANYYAYAKACFQAKGCAAIICPVPAKFQNESYPATPRQWGAWLAFFKASGVPTHVMVGRDWWQVPTEWPHEFTSDATVAGDHAAGEAFIAEQRRWEQRSPAYHAVDKAAVVAAAMARFPREPKRQPTPTEHLVAPETSPPWHDSAKLRESAKRLRKTIPEMEETTDAN